MARTWTALIGLASLLAAGCLDPREREVKRSVERAKAAIDGTARSQASALRLASILEQGGSITTFLAASLAENKAGISFPENPQPYSIVIHRGAIPGEFVIEGFGRGADKPLIVEHAKAYPPKRRGGAP